MKKRGQEEEPKAGNRPSTSRSSQYHSVLTSRPKLERPNSVTKEVPDNSVPNSLDHSKSRDSPLDISAEGTLPVKQTTSMSMDREPPQPDPCRASSTSPKKGRATMLGLVASGVDKDCERQLDEQARTIAKLEDNLARKEEEIKKLQHDLNEAEDDLKSLKLEKCYQISDDRLRELWDDLRYKVRSHTNQRFEAKPGAPIPYFFRDFTDRASEYMRRSTTTKRLLEAVIWRFLVQHVFSLDGLVWAGPLQEDLRNLSKNLISCVKDYSISIEEYHAWRAKCTDMLLRAYPGEFSARHGQEESYIEVLVGDLERLLLPLQIPGYNEDAHPNTSHIIKDAVNIDIHLKRSRAEYWVYMYHLIEAHEFDYDFRQQPNIKPYGFEFNSAHMDCEDGASGLGANTPLVQLVVSPTIVKKGTAKGDQYDQYTVIAKGAVLCNKIRSR
ncbi:hypothetical protein HD806DRAFT_514916 [Xylariaceae sp. AK1471]|nr:hypothetical protein HD806DRAFT_514916 [Xylariaceae sp. AK1471]